MRLFAWRLEGELRSFLQHFLTNPQDERRKVLLAILEKSANGGATPQDKQRVLEVLVGLLVDPRYTFHVLHHFRPIMVDLMARLFRSHRRGDLPMDSSSPLTSFERVFLCVSRVLPLFPQVLEIAFGYFRESPSPLDSLSLLLQGQQQQIVKKEPVENDWSSFSFCLSLLEEEEKEGKAGEKKTSKKEENTREIPEGMERCYHILVGALRLLRFNTTTFARLWNWSAVVSLMSKASQDPSHHHPLLAALAMKCIEVVFGASDSVCSSFVRGCHSKKARDAVDAAILLVHAEWENEKEMMFEKTKHFTSSSSSSSFSITADIDLSKGKDTALKQFHDLANDRTGENGITITQRDLLRTYVVDVCGVLLFRRLDEQPTTTLTTSSPSISTPTLESNSFVYTETSERLMYTLSLCVRERHPVLLTGPPGSGKCFFFSSFFLPLFSFSSFPYFPFITFLLSPFLLAALIEELARVTNNEKDLIRIHLGDEADAKILLGMYMCTETPGEFRWQAGALTQVTFLFIFFILSLL